MMDRTDICRLSVEVSPDFISTMTDAVLSEVREWQQRPLEAMCPVDVFDALRMKLSGEGTMHNELFIWLRACTVTTRVTYWAYGSSGPRGRGSCGGVANDLKMHDLQNILIAVVERLKGIPATINAVFSEATVQTCIVHLIRA